MPCVSTLLECHARGIVCDSGLRCYVPFFLPAMSMKRHRLHLLNWFILSGKALGRYAEGPRFESASVLSLQKLWFVDTVL